MNQPSKEWQSRPSPDRLAAMRKSVNIRYALIQPIFKVVFSRGNFLKKASPDPFKDFFTIF